MLALAVKNDIDVTEHIGLVYHILLRYDVTPRHQYWDDFLSAGQFGLVKAWKSFDPTKGSKFATYASICIINEINMFLRQAKRFASVVSLDAVHYVGADTDNDKITLMDMIQDKRNPYSDIETIDFARDMLSGTLLTDLEKTVVRMLLNNPGLRQIDIRDKLGVSQSHVSRLLTKIKKKIIEKGDL